MCSGSSVQVSLEVEQNAEANLPGGAIEQASTR